MNTLIQAHNDKMNRLVNVSSKRRATELDFFTECSIKYQKYLNAPLALNPHEGKKISDIINKNFSLLDSILPGVSSSTLKELQE